ncbi:MAG: DNA polymerase I [Coprobacillus sp.]|nr:DNA polymerase I [Coprobacillus sp.]
MAKLILVDGNSLLFRAFYATAYSSPNGIMRTSSGVPTNAIFSFSAMINRILKDLNQGDYFMVAFDAGKKTFRNEELETYKANRKAAPDELVKQFPIAREFLKALNIFQFQEEGYEGDDIIGSLSSIAESQNIKTIIYTSDRDFLQLVNDKINVNILIKGMSDTELYDTQKVYDKYGFGPEFIPDYKGLRGDSADNLKGISGVGEKTASKLIETYGDFDSIVKAMENDTSKVGQSIIAEQDQGRLCKQLGIIRKDIELPFDLKDTLYEGYSFNHIKEFCDKYELKTFLNRLINKWKRDDEEEEMVVSDISELDTKDVNEIGIAIDLEDEEDYYNSPILGVGLHIKDKNFYVDIPTLKKTKDLLDLLRNENVKKYCYDYKCIKVALSTQGIEINGLAFDILIATYLLDTSLNKNAEHIFSYFGENISSRKDNTMSLLDMDNSLTTTKIAYFSYKLAPKVVTDLSISKMLDLYNDLELPLVDTLANMEIEGFPLDRGELEEYGKQYQEIINEKEQEIYQLAGKEFNLNSPKQLATLLFEDLGLYDRSGNGSTSVENLNEIREEHPIIPAILEYRKYFKLLSTYVNGLTAHIREDNKIHAQFNQAQTQTGRLSSSNPNLQNIPARDEESKFIRKAMHYEDENLEILSLDYSQIELRVLAHMSGCQTMIDIFNSGLDIHGEMSKRIFHLDGEPTAEQRRKAKTVNFGIIYGISDWGLADRLSIPLKEAKEIITSFYKEFPEIEAYLNKIKEAANKDGYVSTIMGRRRYLSGINDSNYQVREFQKRAAVNAPIQGSAADLIKTAMVKCEKALKEKGLETKMILQIHDELIFKVPVKEKEIVLPLLKDIMSNALKLNVPLEVNGGFGKDWYEAK